MYERCYQSTYIHMIYYTYMYICVYGNLFMHAILADMKLYIINIYHYRAPRVRARINLPEIAPSRRQIIVFVRTGAPRLSHIIETIIYFNHYDH